MKGGKFPHSDMSLDSQLCLPTRVRPITEWPQVYDRDDTACESEGLDAAIMRQVLALAGHHRLYDVCWRFMVEPVVLSQMGRRRIATIVLGLVRQTIARGFCESCSPWVAVLLSESGGEVKFAVADNAVPCIEGQTGRFSQCPASVLHEAAMMGAIVTRRIVQEITCTSLDFLMASQEARYRWQPGPSLAGSGFEGSDQPF